MLSPCRHRRTGLRTHSTTRLPLRHLRSWHRPVVRAQSPDSSGAGSARPDLSRVPHDRVRYPGWSRRGPTELHRQEVRPRARPWFLRHRSRQARRDPAPAKPVPGLTGRWQEQHLRHRSRRYPRLCKVKVRSPQRPLTDASLAPYGQRLVDCLVKAFGEPLAAQGIELTTPKIKVYRNTIKTCADGSARRRSGLLLLDNTNDLLAGDWRRRHRGLHLRATRIRRTCGSRIRPPHAGGAACQRVCPAPAGQEPQPTVCAEPPPRTPGAVLAGIFLALTADDDQQSDRYQLKIWQRLHRR